MTEEKKIKVIFDPGAFDHFDGTQEELDEVVAEITRLAESGELLTAGRPIDWEEMDPEEAEMVKAALDAHFNSEGFKRNLQ